MGTGYKRNDTANNIADGNIINAADLDGEFDAIEAAFATTGHTHDGTAEEGGAITVLGPTQEFVVSSTEAKPSGNAGLSLGTDLLQFNDLYIDGTAYIDGLGESILVDTTSKIQFRDVDLFINSSADGQLDLEADTTIELTAPTVSLTNDLKLKSDSGILYFGADDDVTLTHNADAGLSAKTANGFSLRLQTSDTTIENGNLLGKIMFQAPNEASGGDAVLVGASVEAIAEATFDSTTNSTALVFKTNDSGGALERMRLTSAGNLRFVDNSKALFGAGGDLQIWHNGIKSYIRDEGAGDLVIGTNGSRVEFFDYANSNTLANLITGGAVELHHNGDKKLETTSTGIDVTGDVVSDGLTVDGGATVRSGNADGGGVLNLENTESAVNGQDWGSINFISNDSSASASGTRASVVGTSTSFNGDGNLIFSTAPSNGSNTERMRINSSGRVGIGTVSPSGEFVVSDNGGMGFEVFVNNISSSSNILQSYNRSTSTWATQSYRAKDHIFESNGASERMRIDQNGRVTIGGISAAAWGSAYDVLHVGSSIGGAVYAGSSNAAFITNNAYNDNSSWKYSTSSQAAAYTQYGGTHTWQYAGSGTANNNITWNTALKTDSSGRILLGNTNTTLAIGGFNPQVQLQGTVYNQAAHSASLFSNNSDPALLLFSKSRGTSIGSYTIVQDGDNIGNINWNAADGVDLGTYAARISGQVDGTAAANDIPGRLVFYTALKGAGSISERMRIDNQGNVTIGDSTRQPMYNNVTVLPHLQLSPSNGSGYVIGTANAYSATASNYGQWVGAKSRSNTVGSHVVVQDGDALALFGGQGSDGSQFVEAASIRIHADGTAGANDMPGRLEFHTTADGAAGGTERMRITSSGRVGINETNPGTGLHITGSGSEGWITVENSSTSYSIVDFLNGSGSRIGYVGTYNADNVLYLYSAGSGGMNFYSNNQFAGKFDGGQRFLIGTGTARNDFFNTLNTYTPKTQVETDGNYDRFWSFVHNSTGNSAGHIILGKGGGSSENSVNLVTDLTELGHISFMGTDGSKMVEGARITGGSSDGKTRAAADMPTRLQFYTTSDGAASVTERMRILPTGTTIVSNSGQNISLSQAGDALVVHDGNLVHSRTGTHQGHRTFVRFFQYNNANSNAPTSANLRLNGLTAEFYCKITIVGVNSYSGNSSFTYINESVGYASQSGFTVISANRHGPGTGFTFGTATQTGDYINIPMTSANTSYRFVATAEVIGINEANLYFSYS